MKMTIFSSGNREYFLPDISPGEEVLWRLYFYRSGEKDNWKFNKLQTSAAFRGLFTHKPNKKYERMFKQIEKLEGLGSKMAYKVIHGRNFEPVHILGLEKDTGNLFTAKYAETEMQRITLSQEYMVLNKFQDTDFVPKILQYTQDLDSSFLKVSGVKGENLANLEMDESLMDQLVNMTQFSMNQTKEENTLGLITCLSNGSFSPWNIIKTDNGKYEVIHWQNAADRPLGYDLIYYLVKPFVEFNNIDINESVNKMRYWLEKFYGLFGIEDYSHYLDTCSRIYAAQLDSQGRYIESSKVRTHNRLVLENYEKLTEESRESILGRQKVLFIMHMPPPIHGASMVGKWIHESDRINSTFDCYYLNLTAASNLSDVGRFRLSKAARFLRMLNNIRSLVHRIKPELVYITPNAGGMPFIKDSIVVELLKLMGCHILAHFHNKGVSQYEIHSTFKHMYERFFNNLKVLLIVPSLYEDKKNFLRIRDVYFCANGTPLSMESEIPAERHNKETEILFLSNMIISKGVMDLLDALYLVRGSKLNFHCTLIGAETADLTREKIQEEIDSRFLTDYVEYIGPRYGEDKNKFLLKADMMVFPTYYPKECFPLVILEAMEYKLPVISTREAGIPYSVIDGETGLLCKPQNPISLAEQIEKLILDPKLRWKMGEAGYQLRKEKFNIEHFEDKLCFVLDRAIKDYKEAEKFRKADN